MSNTLYLVTGAAGFLGGTICRQLVERGYNQKVMDVNVGGTKNIIDLCLSHKECKKPQNFPKEQKLRK